MLLGCGATVAGDTIAVMLSGFLGSIIALVILVAAPGNIRRLAFFPPQPSLARLVDMSITGAWEFTTHWFATQVTTLLLAVAIVFFICWQLCPPPEIARERAEFSRRWAVAGLVAVPVVTFALIVGCFAPAIWGMSKLPPGRALLVPHFALACAYIDLALVRGQLAATISRRAARGISSRYRRVHDTHQRRVADWPGTRDPQNPGFAPDCALLCCSVGSTRPMVARRAPARRNRCCSAGARKHQRLGRACRGYRELGQSSHRGLLWPQDPENTLATRR